MEAKDRKTKRVKAMITASQKERYTTLAQDLGITEADLVRRALADYEQAEIEQAEIMAEQERNYQNGIALR